MFELPIPEDIYDYDSFSLKDVLDQITSSLQELGDRPDFPKETASWIKKAKKLHGMISLEIEERRAVEEFEGFLQKGEDTLKALEANPYSSRPIEPSLRDSSELIKTTTRSPKKIEVSQVSTASDSSISKVRFESSAPSQDGESEYDDSRKSVSNMSEEQGSLIYGRMHHAKKKKQTKKNAMFEFMKQTLEATRITNNTMSIGKSSVADVPSRHPHHAEENKEMVRRDKPSVSESIGDSRKPQMRKAFTNPNVNRPIQRPDPGFNPADTRTGSFMELGGPRVENKYKPPKAKKKSPSMNEVTPEREEKIEKAERAKSKKPKNQEEKETTIITVKKKEKPKEDKEAKQVKEVKEVKEMKSMKEVKESKEAPSTKASVPSSVKVKSQEEKPAEKKKVEVKPETKTNNGAVQKGKAVAKEEKVAEEGIKPGANVLKATRNASDDNKSASSKAGSQNLIDIAEEDEEHEQENRNEEAREETKEEKDKAISGPEKIIKESTIPPKESITKPAVQVDVKAEPKIEHIQEPIIETKPQEKIDETIERQSKPKMIEVQDIKPKKEEQKEIEDYQHMKQSEVKVPDSPLPQEVENQAIVENKSKASLSASDIQTKASPTPAFRIRKHGYVKDSERSNEDARSISEQEKTQPGSQRLDDKRSESDYGEESGKGEEGEERSASDESAREERTPGASAEKASAGERYGLRDKINVERVGVKQQSKVFAQSPSRMSGDSNKMPFETKRSDLYTENTRASSNSSLRQKLEQASEMEGPRPLQERAIESRSSVSSAQTAVDNMGQKPGAKISSLPHIETKNKSGKKSNESSPTLSKQKTSLPPIEGNKLILVEDIIKDAKNEKIAKAQQQTMKKVNEASSPTNTMKKAVSNPSSSSSSTRPNQREERTAAAAAQKQAERKGQGEDSRKPESQPKEMAQTRTKNSNPPKPAAGKAGKAGDFPPVAEDDVIDYTNFVQSFQQLFSGSWINPNGFDYLGVMRDLCNMFTVHARTVDNMDTMLAKYKPSIAPLELGPNDLISQGNMNHIFMYSTKTNIDLRMYLERQQVFNKNVNLLRNGEDPDDSQDPATASTRSLYYRVVKTKTEVYDIVTRSFLRKRNWVELPHGMNLKTTWNLLWTWGKPQIDMNKLLVFQKVNHFPGNKGIVRKDLLKANIERIQKLGNKAAAAFNIIPPTFVLPKEITKFIEVFYEHHEREGLYNIWIVKPVGKSRGRGISLMNDIGALKYTETIVAQKYMKNPLLLNGFKFDLRIYVLVTSIDPIEAFIYKEGFARISTVPFSTDIADLDNLFIHLTNSSVQKNSGVIDHTSSDAIVGGTKISLKTLRQRLERKGVAWDGIWTQISDIVVKSLYACQNEINHHPNAFELFGYDIMIDSDLRCWLIEVNSSPSLERMNILDDLVKQQLVDDTIDLVAPVEFDRARLVQVLERRILEEQRCKSSINTSNNSRAQLNKDLTYVLHGKKLREVGEMPAFLGNYERIAPTDMSDKVQRLIQSYKVQYKTPMQQDKK